MNHTYTEDSSVVFLGLKKNYFFFGSVLQTKSETHMHAHKHIPQLPQKHFPCPCIYTFNFLGLTDCTCSNMCSQWAALPVNRLPTTQTENMYSSLTAVVSNHWLPCSKCFHSPLDFFRGLNENSYFAACLFPDAQTECSSLFTRDKTLSLSLWRFKKNNKALLTGQ